jgi:predicted DsbA family dithiol-disulfide isomerase
MVEAAGFRYAPPSVVPNSSGSLQLGELARTRGRHGDLHPRIFAAYWSEGRDIGDRDTLVSLGVSVGLHPDEVRRVVEEQAYLDRIETSTRLAVEVGADGVPAWLIDGETLLTGAQPVEVFDRVLRRLGHGGRRETTRSAR